MATVKKSVKKSSSRIKKAQFGTSCGWGRGEKRYRKPIGQSIKDALWEAKIRREDRKMERERVKEEQKKSGGYGKNLIEGYERDLPGDVSPGGFPGDTGGKKGSRWIDEKGKPRMVGSMKRGGKIKPSVKKAKSATKIVKKSAKKKK